MLRRLSWPALAAVLAPLALLLGFASGRPLVFSLNTAEASLLHGFLWSEGIGSVPRWAKAQARVSLPVVLAGPARVHLTAARPERPAQRGEPRTTEPADVVLRQGEREIARFRAGAAAVSVTADLAAGGPASLALDADTEPRYGVQLQALRVEPLAPFALVPAPNLLLAVALAAALFAAACLWAGLSGPGALLATLALLAAPLGTLAALDPLAALHLARRAVLVDAGLVALAAVFVRHAFAPLAGRCLLVFALAVGLRTGLVYHPRYDYQDVAIHQRMARAVARDGGAAVWSDIALYQQHLDLGRASVAGRFRPLPYPPSFHTLVAWAPALLLVDTMKAMAILAGGFTVLLTMWIAKGLDPRSPLVVVTGLLAALFPEDVLELLRASYPALLGHLADTALVGWLLLRPQLLHTRRGVGLAALALAACALTYNASPVHFALFLPLLWLVAQCPPAITGRAGVLLAAAGGAVLSLGFYGAYLWDTAFKLFLSTETGPAGVGASAGRAWAFWEGLPLPFATAAGIGLAAFLATGYRSWEGRCLLAWALYIPAIALVVTLCPEPFFYFRRYYFAHALLLVSSGWALTRNRTLGMAGAAVLLTWSLLTLHTYIAPFFVTHTGSLAP